MDKDKLPSLSKLLTTFRNQCFRRHGCDSCKYSGCEVCAIDFVYDILTGKAGIDDSFDREVKFGKEAQNE